VVDTNQSTTGSAAKAKPWEIKQPVSSGDTILVRVTGPDRPGITAQLMQVLAASGAGMHDVEQILIRGRLTLSLIITVPKGQDLIKDLLMFGWEQQMEVDFEIVDSTPSERSLGLVVTLLGHDVTPSQFGSIASEVAKHGGNIDRIVRLARKPVMAYELLISGDDLRALQDALLQLGAGLDCDVAVNREGLSRRAKHLIVIDVDSTRVIGKIIDRNGKAEALERIAAEEGIPVDQVVAVGDGANDLDMLNTAGLGVAFNAKALVQEAADAAVNVPYLDALLFILGVRSEDISEPH